MPYIHISITHNDEKGNPTSNATTVSFSSIDGNETVLRLEANNWLEGGQPIKVYHRGDGSGHFNLEGVVIVFQAMAQWDGSMASNGYTVGRLNSLSLVQKLAYSGNWNVVEGWDVPYNKFKQQEKFFLSDFGWAVKEVRKEKPKERQLSFF